MGMARRELTRLGLVAAAILLAPWKLKFAVDARTLYKRSLRAGRG
jgi:hypothetical protein